MPSNTTTKVSIFLGNLSPITLNKVFKYPDLYPTPIPISPIIKLPRGAKEIKLSSILLIKC